MATETSIKLAAIARLGSEVPQSVDADTDEVAALDRIYDSVVDEFLCRHAWTFATHTTILTVTTTVPDLPWLYQYDLPADCINVREVRREKAPALYELYDNHVLAMSNEDLTLVHNWRPSEERWPGDFAAAVEEETLGRLFEAFEEPTRGERTREVAESKLIRAARRDRRQKPAPRGQRPRALLAWYNRTPGRV